MSSRAPLGMHTSRAHTRVGKDTSTTRSILQMESSLSHLSTMGDAVSSFGPLVGIVLMFAIGALGATIGIACGGALGAVFDDNDFDDTDEQFIMKSLHITGKMIYDFVDEVNVDYDIIDHDINLDTTIAYVAATKSLSEFLEVRQMFPTWRLDTVLVAVHAYLGGGEDICDFDKKRWNFVLKCATRADIASAVENILDSERTISVDWFGTSRSKCVVKAVIANRDVAEVSDSGVEKT